MKTKRSGLYINYNGEFLLTSFIKQEDGSFWLRVWQNQDTSPIAHTIINKSVEHSEIGEYEDLSSFIIDEIFRVL